MPLKFRAFDQLVFKEQDEQVSHVSTVSRRIIKYKYKEKNIKRSVRNVIINSLEGVDLESFSPGTPCYEIEIDNAK